MLLFLDEWLVLVGLEQSAILVVSIVKRMMEAQLSLSPLSLRDLSWETFTFTFTVVLWDVTPCRLA